MKIVVAGPMSLSLLRNDVGIDEALGDGYAFPFVARLIKQLHRHGHSVAGVTTSPAVTRTLKFESDRLAVYVCPTRTRPRHRARDFFAAERRAILECIEHEQPDVVHGMWAYEFGHAALSSGRPYLVTAHDWPVTILRMMPSSYRAMRLVHGMYVMRRAEALSAPSPYLAALVSRWSGTDVTVVPNAIEPEMLGTARRAESTNALSLGAINNGWGQPKNVDTLLTAFKLVRQHKPDCSLTLYGAGYEAGGAANEWARLHRADDGVVFAGPIAPDDVQRALQQIDLFVHPSLTESFGVVLIEAMASGVPVIGGATSGAVPWVLGDGVSGALTDVSSADDLASTILALADDRAERERLSANGINRVRSCFTTPVVARDFERLYAMASRPLAGS